jgi:hypothetical protein
VEDDVRQELCARRVGLPAAEARFVRPLPSGGGSASAPAIAFLLPISGAVRRLWFRPRTDAVSGRAAMTLAQEVETHEESR